LKPLVAPYWVFRQLLNHATAKITVTLTVSRMLGGQLLHVRNSSHRAAGQEERYLLRMPCMHDMCNAVHQATPWPGHTDNTIYMYGIIQPKVPNPYSPTERNVRQVPKFEQQHQDPPVRPHSPPRAS
jgi:hypothetical protein